MSSPSDPPASLVILSHQPPRGDHHALHHPPRTVRDRRDVHRGRRRRRHSHPARSGHAALAPDGGDFPRDTAQRPTVDLIAEGILRDIPGLFPHDPTAPDVAAIILTHSHLDHWGLAHHAHPAIPVYGSEGTIAVLEVGRVFFPDSALPTDLRRARVE